MSADADAETTVGADAVAGDAFAPGAAELGPGEDASPLEREVWATIDEIPDPHIPLSLVEMAMVYDVEVVDGTARVDLTFPCMGCPAYDFIHDDIRAACRTIDGVRDVEIDVVWDPVWSKDMLTASAREKLRESGIGL